MIRALSVVLFASLIGSCGPTSRPPYTISIVTASGDNPFRSYSIASGTITIRVRQGDTSLPPVSGRISGTVLQPIDVSIPSFGLVTRIQVEIEIDESGTPDAPELIGASPPFVPLGYATVRLVVGRPGECRLLSAPLLSSARVGPNLVAIESNLIAIGGDEPRAVPGETAPSTRVDAIYPVQLTLLSGQEEFTPTLEVGIGAGGAVRLGQTTQIVALSDARRAVLYFPDLTRDRDVDLTDAQTGNPLHLGAGPSSALVALGESGVAIVGGIAGDDPSDGITWVDLAGRTTTSRMSTARVRPAALWVGNHVLVAGGQGPDGDLFELIAISDHSIATQFGGDEPRFAPVLVRDPGSARAWLGFGEGSDGALLTSTVRIDGCPSACVAAPWTPIDRPRRGVRVVERAHETVIIGGAGADGPTDFVDRVRFTGGAPMIEPLGSLAAARDRPGAAAIGAGIVIVAGGEGVSPDLHALNSLEICFPEALDDL